MEWLLPLYIFPQGSLDSSVITTVWVGVFVVAFFNLRFGWVLSGLVVPGYLIPLLLIKPWAVLAILIEGITAYYLIWFFSEFLSRYGYWSALFGRDRFFGLILASIATRVAFDGWLLPILGESLQTVGIVFDYRNELHSLGLVVVALMANQFWKSGVVRGLPPLLVSLFFTWLIVRYVLMEFTNFGLGSVSYMYEDLAASILASPKAYIILITTAFVASRMNLRYGWDFNGILLPALLALQWYEPLKILISFVEAFVILWLAIAVLKLPLFANASIEGARKLLLFFNISFAYKLVLSYLLFYFLPDLKISDYFAFGFLLSTLLAIKMHDKGIAIRMTRATLQTSLISILIASVLGFMLTLLPELNPWKEKDKFDVSQQFVESAQILIPRLSLLKPDIYRGRFEEITPPLPQEVDRFSEGVSLLLSYARGNDKAQLPKAKYALYQAGYQIELIENQYLLIHEANIKHNWGVYVINLRAANELLLEVPLPLQHRGLIEGVTALFSVSNARSLAISGGREQFTASQPLFDVFHRLAGRRDVLQVHAYDRNLIRNLNDNEKYNLQNLSKLENSLWVKKRLPPGLNLQQLEKVIGQYEINWAQTAYKNPQRDASRDGYAELYLNSQGLRRLLISPLLGAQSTQLFVGAERIDGYLQRWLQNSKDEIAKRGSNAYSIPRVEELVYFDEEVLTPIINSSDRFYKNHDWTQEGLEDLRTINGAARVLNYQIIRYRHQQTGNDYLILSEIKNSKRGYWGTYVFRMGESRAFMLQVPRPLFEINSFEVSVALFERLQGRALLIGGTHPLANQNYTADLLRQSNKTNVFNLVHQVLMRESDTQPLMSLQVRAFGQHLGQEMPDEDVLVAFADGAENRNAFKPLQKKLIASLRQDDWDLRFVDGSISTIGYHVGMTPQSRYLNATANKHFAILWVSPLVRASFKQQDDDKLLNAQFSALNIESYEGDVVRQIMQNISSDRKVRSAALSKKLINDVDSYQVTRDIILLKRLIKQDKQLYRYTDINTRQAFLFIHNKSGQLQWVSNLNPRNYQTTQVINEKNRSQKKIEMFIESRMSRLILDFNLQKTSNIKVKKIAPQYSTFVSLKR
jgi:gamma-polyglutamate biosynthesis protein CapC